jgi:ABC-2 family transporter
LNRLDQGPLPLPTWGYFAGRIIATVLLAGSLGALALAAAGTAVTPLLTSAQGANPLLTLTYLPLIIFSGGFGGLSGLPHWLNTLMSYLPAQPMIDAVTRALQPSAGLSGRDLAVLAAWALGGCRCRCASSGGIRSGRSTLGRPGGKRCPVTGDSMKPGFHGVVTTNWNPGFIAFPRSGRD